MVNPIPSGVRHLWENWKIRSAILFSLLLQTILIAVAPYRKRTAHKLVVFFVWSGYLLADAIAIYAIGLISNSNNETDDSKQAKHPENGDLLAFWSTFLLLHLGGPDTITAFALADNELWIRHVIALVMQAAATVYLFLLTLPGNKVTIPTILLFIAGVTKYLERSVSLYLASTGGFRDSLVTKPDPGPNYAKLMEEYESKKEANLPAKITIMPEPDEKIKIVQTRRETLNELQIVRKAYRYFNIFKGLIVDLIFSFKERNDSRDFFRRLGAEDAFRVIEVELNFLYEVMFTKAVVVHSRWGYTSRCITLTSAVASVSYFRFRVHKHGYYNGFDVGVTYALLAGAIVLDLYSFVMAVFSDWTVAKLDLKKSEEQAGRRNGLNFFIPIFSKLVDLKKSVWDYQSEEDNHSIISTGIFFRRWSGRVAGLSLIRYCLSTCPTKIHHVKCKPNTIIKWWRFVKGGIRTVISMLCKWTGRFVSFLGDNGVTRQIIRLCRFLCINKLFGWFGVLKTKLFKDLYDEITYVSHEPLTKELWNFIFNELQRKSNIAGDIDTALRICSARGDWVLQSAKDKDRTELMRYVLDVTYDESLLLWHIATELLYQTENDVTPLALHYNAREYSKILSDYMLYLLVMRPTVMAAVGGIGKIRFGDTCAEAERLFKRKSLLLDEKQACDRILRVNTDYEPSAVKGDRSKSVLFEACRLAKVLDKAESDKWEILSKIWVELLSFAAIQCRASAHAEQVSKGGELITFVWLLMVQFGLGDQFQINEGHARAKLIVGIAD